MACLSYAAIMGTVELRRWLVTLSGPARAGVLGAVAAGFVGCVVGLVIGLSVYPPTAWAATVEIGLPAALVGAAGGALVGLLRPRSAPRHPS